MLIIHLSLLKSGFVLWTLKSFLVSIYYYFIVWFIVTKHAIKQPFCSRLAERCYLISEFFCLMYICLSQNKASAALLGSDSLCLSLGLVPVTIPAMG